MNSSSSFRVRIRTGCIVIATWLLGSNPSQILMANQPSGSLPATPHAGLPALPHFPEVLETVMNNQTVKNAWQALVQVRHEGEAAGVVWNQLPQVNQEATALVLNAVGTQKIYIDSAIEALGQMRSQWITQGHPSAIISEHSISMGQQLLTEIERSIYSLFIPVEESDPE